MTQASSGELVGSAGHCNVAPPVVDSPLLWMAPTHQSLFASELLL